MSALAHGAAFLAAIAAGLGVSLAALTLLAPLPVPPEIPGRAPPAAADTAPPDAPAPWPALFGQPAVAVAPPPPPAAAPPPPQVARDYRLKGLVATGDLGWAIIDDGSAEQLLRQGDQVSGGETIVAITASGVLIEGPSGQRRITFDPMDMSLTAAARPDTPLTDTPRPDAGAAAKAPGGPRPATGPRARALPAVALDPRQFDGQRLSDIITRAGGIAQSDLPHVGPVLEILWVRNGLLYDRLGLKSGDKIKTINGQPITQVQNSAELVGLLLQARRFTLELVRGGADWTLEIEVQDAT